MMEREDSQDEMREKYWSELNDTEKIGRLHEVVKRQENTISSLYDLVHRLLHHQHGSDGRLLIDLHSVPQSSGMGQKQRNDKVYF